MSAVSPEQPNLPVKEAESLPLPLPIEEPLPELTERQRRFVEEYLIDGIGSKAAIRAGYSPNGSTVCASQLLAYPKIIAALAKAKEQRAVRVGMTADQVLAEMAILANANVNHYEVDAAGNLKAKPDAPDGAMRAVQSVKTRRRLDKEGNLTVEVEFKLWDKPGSIKMMGKQIGLFPDKVELSGPGGKPIEVIGKVERVIVDGKTDEPKA